jgi:hypothetical protein
MKFEDAVPEKSQIHREHMERVRIKMAAEEEALKFSRVIKGVDQKKYKDIRYTRSAKEEWSDRIKLEIMRGYQFLIGLAGFFGVGVILWGIIKERILHLTISKHFVIDLDLLLIGCTLAVAGIVGIIGFQHKHDKISDRLYGRK